MQCHDSLEKSLDQSQLSNKQIEDLYEKWQQDCLEEDEYYDEHGIRIDNTEITCDDE